MSVAYSSATSSTGICTVTAPAGNPQTTWNLCSLQVSMAGPTVGPNGVVTVWDGLVGSGTVLYRGFLDAPVQAGLPTGGSVGHIQDIPLPKSPQGIQGVQGTPGNQMNVQVIGTGANIVTVNARFSDGLP